MEDDVTIPITHQENSLTHVQLPDKTGHVIVLEKLWQDVFREPLLIQHKETVAFLKERKITSISSKSNTHTQVSTSITVPPDGNLTNSHLHYTITKNFISDSNTSWCMLCLIYCIKKKLFAKNTLWHSFMCLLQVYLTLRLQCLEMITLFIYNFIMTF